MKQKDILVILILLFVFVVVWIGYTLYNSLVRSQLPESLAQDVLPIQPAFDTKTIEDLKQRQKLEPSFEIEITTPTPLQETLPDSTAPQSEPEDNTPFL
jgi:hypothetical protein